MYIFKLVLFFQVLEAQEVEQLKYISLYDRSGVPELFLSNIVDEGCISGRNAKCQQDCGYITDKTDYYGQLKCRFCLIRWQCMDQSKLRKCGKSKCSAPCDDENRGKSKSYYGLPSVWRQKECLTCLIKEECATEFDLKMHYGFTRTCVGECVSRYSNVCPSLPEADKCSHNCHQTCGYGEDTDCFQKCVSATCPNMQDQCIDCIERCAASKIVVQEVDDRSSDFEMPQLKAHFSESFIASHNLAPAVPEVGRFREKKNKDNAKKKARRERRKKKKTENGKKVGTKRQRKQEKKQTN